MWNFPEVTLRGKKVYYIEKKKEFRDPITAWFPREMTSEERAQKFHTDDN